MESEIEKVIDVWITILNNATVKGKVSGWNSEMDYVMHSFSSFLEAQEEELIGRKKSLFQTEIYRNIEKSYINDRGVKTQSIIDKLKMELNDLIIAFELYIQLFVETVIPNKCIDLSAIKPELVVNFNYTDTNKIYGIDQSKVKYVHGKIGSEPNNIVMGMNVYGNDYNRDFVYFMKFFQRIQHSNDILKVKDLFELAKSGGNHRPPHKIKKQHWQKVYFVGHSMSNADGDVIRLLKSPVMESETFEIESKFIIYYYDQRDYEQKVINLFEVFGKDETIQMIYDEEVVFLPLKTILCKE